MLAAGLGDCVSLGQGVPSFPTPPHVIEAVFRALRDAPSAGKYSLQPGMAELRWAVAEQLATEKGLETNPETEIAITVGGMEALLCAVLCLCDRGDEVIVPEPFYPSHEKHSRRKRKRIFRGDAHAGKLLLGIDLDRGIV